uniref:Neur_chan_memb domain-containing protein n=1 Tax=Angiostrongylus cantonensis TaxID=6313 RepID=A0A0K0DR29_ANGCA
MLTEQPQVEKYCCWNNDPPLAEFPKLKCLKVLVSIAGGILLTAEVSYSKGMVVLDGSTGVNVVLSVVVVIAAVVANGSNGGEGGTNSSTEATAQLCLDLKPEVLKTLRTVAI